MRERGAPDERAPGVVPAPRRLRRAPPPHERVLLPALGDPLPPAVLPRLLPDVLGLVLAGVVRDLRRVARRLGVAEVLHLDAALDDRRGQVRAPRDAPARAPHGVHVQEPPREVLRRRERGQQRRQVQRLRVVHVHDRRGQAPVAEPLEDALHVLNRLAVPLEEPEEHLLGLGAPLLALVRRRREPHLAHQRVQRALDLARRPPVRVPVGVHLELVLAGRPARRGRVAPRRLRGGGVVVVVAVQVARLARRGRRVLARVAHVLRVDHLQRVPAQVRAVVGARRRPAAPSRRSAPGTRSARARSPPSPRPPPRSTRAAGRRGRSPCPPRARPRPSSDRSRLTRAGAPSRRRGLPPRGVW